MSLLNRNQSMDSKRIIFKKYKIKQLICESQFSKVYLGKNIKTSEKVVLKIALKDCVSGSLLEKEAYFLYILKSEYIPDIKSFGIHGRHYVLVQNLLGQNLLQVVNSIKNYRLDLKDTCLSALQMLDRLEFIHSKLIIHRDIKPENFVLGNPNTNLIYLIDYGNSKKYMSSKTSKHIEFKKIHKFQGNYLYSSLNTMMGYEQSRRDDLESVGYTLINLHKFSLPWNGVLLNRKMHTNLVKSIIEVKNKTSIKDICKDLPIEFEYYLNYVRNLKFDEAPNYEYLKGLFKSIINTRLQQINYKFSWAQCLTFSATERKQTLNKSMARRSSSLQKRLYQKIKYALEKKNNDTVKKKDTLIYNYLTNTKTLKTCYKVNQDSVVISANKHKKCLSNVKLVDKLNFNEVSSTNTDNIKHNMLNTLISNMEEDPFFFCQKMNNQMNKEKEMKKGFEISQAETLSKIDIYKKEDKINDIILKCNKSIEQIKRIVRRLKSKN